MTIWGESAGAASCTLLPLIKGSHQYFKRVIAQSGAPAQTRSAEQAIACTNSLMEKLGCKTVADLLKISAEDIMKVWAPILGLYSALGIRTFPERDGIYLPLDPWEAYANGTAKDIEFLQGCDKDEMNTFMGALGVDAWNAWAKERTAEPWCGCMECVGQRAHGREARPTEGAGESVSGELPQQHPGRFL